MLVHNPNPSGGVTDLAVQMNGFVEGLGVWDIRMWTDAVRWRRL